MRAGTSQCGHGSGLRRAGTLLGQPPAVGHREAIVSDQAPLQEGNLGGPLVKFAGSGRDGAT